VRRNTTAPDFTLNYREEPNRTRLHGKNLAKHGLTKYEIASGGTYV